MTALHAVTVVDTDGQLPTAKDEAGAMVAAIAAVLQQTVASLDRTVSRITEMTVLGGSRVDHELIIALQDFDLLQQEFATLGEVLAQLPGGMAPGSAAGHPLLASIPIAGLKERLSRKLDELLTGTQEVDGQDEAEF